MQKLSREHLFSLEQYHRARPEFRAKVMAHKKQRQLGVGPNVTLLFEDRLTMQYQVQEMLRAERIYELEGIQEELNAYNPLIPDGDNWKATCMIEFEDPKDRQQALAQMIGIENRIWVRIGGFAPVYAIADEDLERSTEQKTSAVHFLRFQLPAAQINAIKGGDSLTVGIDHPGYSYDVTVSEAMRKQLIADLH